MSTPAASGNDDLLLGRQPILDRQQRLVAYELLFRCSRMPRGGEILDGVMATSRVLVNTLNHLGLDKVLGDKKAFINVSAEFLANDVIELLPRERVVLEILESVTPGPEVVARCQQLRDAGFELALDDFVYHESREPLIPLASYIKIDLRAQDMAATRNLVTRLRARVPALLAEKVETLEDFRACQAMGFDYFQGYYFARPEVLSAKRLDPAMQSALQLFNLVANKAEIGRIEAGFREDVALTYNFLRYINSVGMGLTHKVTQLRHALVVLGYTKLSRWLSLLLMSFPGHSGASHALFRTALVRARLAELLGQKRLGERERDLLFVAGMFSMLDALLGRPLSESLGELNLPTEVPDALLRKTGPLAPYLTLVHAIESADFPAVEIGTHALGLSVEQVNVAHSSALGWAEQLSNSV
jgi:EAL and modified HD-GYP domain-containing signal transduction protein